MRTFLLALSVAVAAPLLTVARPADAQVSDSERQAARQLFNDGVALQEAGHYAEALDKFQRAQRVIFAHTNLVHIGECQTQLGKWVEAAETYRLAIRTPTNGNQAFQDAQDKSKQELAALEPRIPKLKIDVTPKDAPDLQVQIDGQPVNAALIDVPMPLDPGAHKIVAFAAGYTSAEASVTLQEKDTKSVALTIAATGGVTYTTPNGTPIPPPPGAVLTAPPPPPPPPTTMAVGAPTQERWRPPPPIRPASERGLLLGIHLGLDAPGGDRSGTSGDSMSHVAKAGGAFGLDALMHWGKWGVGLFYEYASFSQGDDFSALVGRVSPDRSVTANEHSHYLGILGTFVSNPAGVGFYGEVGLGYRIFSDSARVALTSDSSQYYELSETLTSPEILLGAGIYIRAGSWLRIIPKANVGIGSFGGTNVSCSSSGSFTCDPGQTGIGTGTTNFDSTSSHAFFFLGASGFYEVPL